MVGALAIGLICAIGVSKEKVDLKLKKLLTLTESMQQPLIWMPGSNLI